MYKTFEEILPLVRDGKKARMVDWGDPMYDFIKIINTQEFNEEENTNSQPFIALFYINACHMPHPYSYPSYDILGGQWEIID